MRILWILFLSIPLLASLLVTAVCLVFLFENGSDAGVLIAFAIFAAISAYLFRLVVKSFEPEGGVLAAVTPGSQPNLTARKMVTLVALLTAYAVLGAGVVLLVSSEERKAWLINKGIWFITGFFLSVLLISWLASVIAILVRIFKEHKSKSGT